MSLVTPPPLTVMGFSKNVALVFVFSFNPHPKPFLEPDPFISRKFLKNYPLEGPFLTSLLFSIRNQNFHSFPTIHPGPSSFPPPSFCFEFTTPLFSFSSWASLSPSTTLLLPLLHNISNISTTNLITLASFPQNFLQIFSYQVQPPFFFPFFFPLCWS